jgi:SAM-dependent methyltransferase
VKRGRKENGADVLDKFILYSAAVQSTDVDLDFFERVYRKHRGDRFRTLREDFCGTAALACEWVRRREANRAWGIDLDGATLDWGRRMYVSRLGAAAERLTLLRGDVRDTPTPLVDVVCALNFSYYVLKRRDDLLGYLKGARRALRPGGLLFLDAYGGTEAICREVERRRILPCKAFDGTEVPRFDYVWEQASFNPVDHATVCHIHFRIRKNGRVREIRRAFTYDWRLWTLPELRELLVEAGFRAADVYVEGWDDEADDTDGVYRLRRRFENQTGWVAYIVGVT